MTLENSINIQLKGIDYWEDFFKSIHKHQWQTKSTKCSKLKTTTEINENTNDKIKYIGVYKY